MKLIVSDITLTLPPVDATYIDLSKLKIANCVGCFGCWTKTPGKCVIRDDAVKVYPYIAKSDTILYITRIQYGCYDTPMKTMLERAIPVQMAFIRLLDGETHHVQRAVVPKTATMIAYGDSTEEEREIFRSLVDRNARNMNFQSYRVLFVPETRLTETVYNEVKQWNKL